MDCAKREMFMKRADVTDRNNVHTHIASTNLSSKYWLNRTQYIKCQMYVKTYFKWLFSRFNI